MTGAICAGRQRVLSPGECGIKECWSTFQGEHTPLTSTNGYLNLHQYDGREVKTKLPCCSSHASDTQQLHLACGYHMGGGRTSIWHFCTHKLALLWGFLGAGGVFSFPGRSSSTVNWQGLGSMHQNLSPYIHPAGEVGPVWPSLLP